MGHIALKGDEAAIDHAAELLRYERCKGGSRPVRLEQIREQFGSLVDKVMGEGALYAPDLAALAIKQASGDPLEASFLLRAYRTTKPRAGCTLPADTSKMRIIRRISAAFKEIPGGQVLGPSADYALRLLDFDLVNENAKRREQLVRSLFGNSENHGPLPESFPKVVDMLRESGLLVLPEPGVRYGSEPTPPTDITRQTLTFPASRSGALQSMARGETGGLLLLAYSNMRGYGDVHPVIGELRVGYLPLTVEHPYRKRPVYIGEIKVTEAEVIAKFTASGKKAGVTLGYGLCFGHNETKAIAMAVLDRAMQTEAPSAVSENQEFVLSHIDGIESMGFCTHYKSPHYVTFESELQRLRAVTEQSTAESYHSC